MITAREKLFGSNEIPCDAGEACIMGGLIKKGDDVIVTWINRGIFPFSLANIVSLDGAFELMHTDCATKLGLWGERIADQESNIEELKMENKVKDKVLESEEGE